MVRMRCSGMLSSVVNNAVGGSNLMFPCRPLKLLLLLVGLSALAWLPAIVLTEGQFDNDIPILLTNMINGHHPMDYNVFDQCLSRAEMRDDIQSYALEFKMPSNFLCGNEGHSLRQEHMIDHMQIQLSSSKRGYNTLIRFPIRKTTMLDKDERYDNFMKLAEHGCYMEELPGLWMLAMDMLPMAKQQILDLFVYRDSQCTMQAWFVRPFDQYGQLPTEMTAGSMDQRPIPEVKKVVPLGDFKIGERIQIWIFIPFDDYPTVEVQLNSNDTMVYTIFITREEIHYESSNHRETNHFATPVLNKTDHARIGIIKIDDRAFVFTFDEGKVHAENSILPKGWSENEYGDDDDEDASKSVETMEKSMVLQVIGENVVFGKVERQLVNIENMTTNDTVNFNKSWKLKQAVTKGTKITGRIKMFKNAESLQFNLLHDAPEFHSYIGATIMRIQWFKEHDTIFWGSYHHGSWKKKENHTTSGFFKHGYYVECVLTIDADSKTKNAQITVVVNKKKMGVFVSDLPIWTLNWLQLSGNIKMMQEPQIEYGKEHSDLSKYELPHLFNYGNTICFNAKMKEEFTMYLFHESNEFSKTIGDTLLRIHVDSSKRELFLGRRLYHQDKWIEEEQIGDSGFYNRNDEEILIQIVAKDNKFIVLLNGMKPVGSLEYGDTKPWLVNWLMVEGLAEVKIAENSSRCLEQNTAKLEPLPSNIMQLYPNDLMEIDDVIHITGTVEENANADPKVLVYLFREALEFHERYGQTMLLVEFSKEEFTLNSYIPDCTPDHCTKKWQMSDEEAPRSKIDKPLEAGQIFELQIKAADKTMFEVHYGENSLNCSNAETPLWAAQYIVVMGLDDKKVITFEKTNGQKTQ